MDDDVFFGRTTTDGVTEEDAAALVTLADFDVTLNVGGLFGDVEMMNDVLLILGTGGNGVVGEVMFGGSKPISNSESLSVVIIITVLTTVVVDVNVSVVVTSEVTVSVAVRTTAFATFWPKLEKTLDINPTKPTGCWPRDGPARANKAMLNQTGDDNQFMSAADDLLARRRHRFLLI